MEAIYIFYNTNWMKNEYIYELKSYTVIVYE